MRSLACKSPGFFEYKEINAPAIQPKRAIIKIKRVGICGTDLHAYQGTQPYFSYPRILGHELSGDLIEADDADGFVPGQPVTCIPYINCGVCVACKQGKPNCCVNLTVCGVHIDGGMVDYLSVPSDTLIQGRGLNHDELAMVEPLAIGAHGVRRAACRQNEQALVIGAGPIGLGTMEFARIAGAKVIAMDINENRLEFCKNQLCVPSVINPATENAIDRLMEITDGEMPTVVFDATGNQQAINSGLRYLAHGGRYILIGLQKDEIIFSHPEFHKRETTLMSSRNATREDFEHVISCIKSDLVKPSNYITHRVKFQEAAHAFRLWIDPASGTIKAMVEMD